MKKAIFLMLCWAVLSLAITTYTSRAEEDWSSWQNLHQDVYISYKQVQTDTWTWRFKNASNITTITYMAFTYRDKAGEHTDVLPGNLKPGEVFGGWAAFTADSKPTSFYIKEIRRTVK